MLRRLLFLTVLILTFTLLFSGCFWQKDGEGDVSDSETSGLETLQSGGMFITEDDITKAKEVVRLYIDGLENGNYDDSYNLLSLSSQKTHSLSDFKEDIKLGMPQLDLDNMNVKANDDGTILVSVNFIEDPSTAGYNLIFENENWCIVYQGGSPAMPTAIMTSDN